MPYRPAPIAVVAAVSAVVILLALMLGGTTGRTITVTALVLGGAAIVAALAIVRRDRLRHQEALREQAVTHAVVEERMAITRDLHDIVSNGLGLITVRAGVAAAVHGPDLGELRAALLDVERISRATTLELRRMLVPLRGGDVPLSPAPGLPDIETLVQTARRGGLQVDLEVQSGRQHTQGVQLTAYRVVQEALANVARHAGPTRVEVCLRDVGDALLVEVRDHGPVAEWPAREGQGFGLLGLRERVTALGGELQAGADDAGFVVRAVLPDQEGEG